MTLKSYLEIIKKNKKYIFICTIFCGIVALIFSLSQPITYDSTVTLSVHSVNRQNAKDFQYDNYYAIQASELLGNTVVGWLETPNIIFEIYEKAELTPAPEEVDQLVKKMKAKQISSHSIEINFNQSDRDKAEKISTSLVNVIDEKVKALESTGDKKNSFEVIASNPMISEKEYNPVLITIIGLISGLLIGIGLGFFFEYFKE